MTVMGDASMEGLSDRGSIPLRSISKPQHMLRFYLHMFGSRSISKPQHMLRFYLHMFGSSVIIFNRGKLKKGY